MRHDGDLTITKQNLWKFAEITEVSGSVYISAENASLPALTKSGSVYIRAENASLPALTKSGYVDISAENASLPALTKSGSVDIRAENASLPALTEVSGSVYIRAENASLPALTKSGSVYIRAENASLPALTEVSGSVYISAENASLPALTKSGSVYIRAENASLPALTKSGYVDISAENASLPALTEVSGYVYISAENASLPALTKSGSVYIRAENASLPALTEVSGSVYISAENASLPALTKSGSVYIRAENASLPALTKSGSVYIRAENASLPALTKSGYVDISAENASLPALTEVSGYVFEMPSPALARERLAEVARHALAAPDSLDMRHWHTCKTTHCVAGWAIHLAGADGYELERKVGSSNAGLILLGPQAAGAFYLPSDRARAKLEAALAVAIATRRAATRTSMAAAGATIRSVLMSRSRASLPQMALRLPSPTTSVGRSKITSSTTRRTSGPIPTTPAIALSRTASSLLAGTAMTEPRDLALVRNAIAILCSLDRHEIEPIGDREWVAFRDSPWRTFLTMGVDRRECVWRSIQARLPERLRETLNPTTMEPA